MKTIIIDDDALAELDEAMAYHEKREAGLGLDLRGLVMDAIAKIQENPAMRSHYKNTGFRHYVIRRFKYVIYYKELEDVIWISAIAHGRRRPDYWLKRRINREES